MRRTLSAFASVGFGLAGFVVAFTLGSALTLTTGIPLLGGLLNGVLVSAILTIGRLAIGPFGTATVMWLAFSLPATLTTTLGPPGWYKVPIAVVAGLIWDIVYHAFRKSTFGLYCGAVLGALSIMGLLILALWLGFGKDAEAALKKYMGALPFLLAINVTVTAIGVYLGRKLFVSRLSRLPVFENMKGINPDQRDTPSPIN
jgi:hypothetical protein